MRYPAIRRSGRAPQPADFDHNFPALIARTLADPTGDERHVLRSVTHPQRRLRCDYQQVIDAAAA
ncbi:hypothetical protein [Streptomyces sp. NPDC017941]|uniref:hypothetical protein n=1 Tax=Streptomyces sp. NPDC017941 TaxID=3365018 RepID=UPI0037B9B7DB